MQGLLCLPPPKNPHADITGLLIFYLSIQRYFSAKPQLKKEGPR